jgi:hypothetical protein
MLAHSRRSEEPEALTQKWYVSLFQQFFVRKNIISSRIPGSGEGKDLRSFMRKRIGI